MIELQNLEVIAIVQARMGSSRFPGKVLKKIYKDDTVLDMVVNRIELSPIIDKVVVATTNDPLDDVIVDHCDSKGIAWFRGPEDNVMQRALQAADNYNSDIIVDITADCPLVDPEHITRIVRTLVANKLDYCSNVMERTWPDGLDIQAYTIASFVELASNFSVEEEHTGYNYIKFKDAFKCENIPAPPKYRRPHWELTIDYPVDLSLLKILVEWIANTDEMDFLRIGFDVESILDILERHPILLAINQNLKRKKESNPIAKEVI